METAESGQVENTGDDTRSIPKVGLGTWELTGPEGESAVRDALEIGYRHIDTARAYGNEREVGTAIGGSGIPREQIFLTTKLQHEELSAGQVREQLEGSLKALGVDYVDLLLIHWPNPNFELAETLETMAELRSEEKLRHLGVSNFPSDWLARALELSPVPLLANQVEMHPYLDQSALLEMCAAEGVALEAYSPLANGKLIGDQVLEGIGSNHGKSGPQVALRWLIDHPHVVALPRSSSRENRLANFDIMDFELDPGERERIAGLARPDGRQIDPPWAPDWD